MGYVIFREKLIMVMMHVMRCFSNLWVGSISAVERYRSLYVLFSSIFFFFHSMWQAKNWDFELDIQGMAIGN